MNNLDHLSAEQRHAIHMEEHYGNLWGVHLSEVRRRLRPSTPTEQVTAAEYAAKHGVSVSTAHRRLKAMVYAGQATWSNSYIHHTPSRLADIKTPPPAMVIVYTLPKTE